MTTLEDTFNDYDGNSIKISANYQGNNKIAKYSILDYDSDFYKYESFNRKVKRNIIDNLRTNHYIKIGCNCPICYEPINHRKNAYLTDCGHSFHYDCIINYDYVNTFTNINVNCPICRQDMGLYDELKIKYKNSNNSFDNLEDFEMNMKNKIPKVCYNIHKLKYSNHFYRMDYFNCFYCQL